MLPANLELWDGVRQKEVQEGGDTCAPVTYSCGCVAETSTVL